MGGEISRICPPPPSEKRCLVKAVLGDSPELIVVSEADLAHVNHWV